MGLIWIQEAPLGPGAVGSARSPSAQELPRGFSWLPPKDMELSPPTPQGLSPGFTPATI